MLTEAVDAKLKQLSVVGMVLTGVGLVLLAYAVFVFKTYVISTPDVGEVGRQLSEGLDLSTKTHNIGLIAEQYVLTLLGGFTMIAGTILWLGGFIGRVIVEQPSIS